MNKEGPPLEALLRRLAECPGEFQLAPWLSNLEKNGRGIVHVDALVNDWLRDAGMEPMGAHDYTKYRAVAAKLKSDAASLVVPQDAVPPAQPPAAATTGKAKGSKDKDKNKPVDEQAAALAAHTPATTNWLRLVSLSIWLLHEPVFLKGNARRASIVAFLNTELDEVAQVSDVSQYITDGDRREELARRALRAFDMRPAGESREHADDRLTTLDSVELRRVAIASRQAEERARAIREAMARKAAEEAAATYNRE